MKTAKYTTKIALLAAALLTVSCGGDSEGDSGKAVTGVSLNKSTLTLATDGSETLTATVTPSTAVDKSVSWGSLDTSTATVDNTGLVKAVDVGQTTIIATTADGDRTATCVLTVEIQKDGWEQLQPTQIRYTDTEHDAWVSFYFTDRKCTSAQAQFNYNSYQAAQISFDGLSAEARANGEVNGTYFWVDMTGVLLTPFTNKTMAQIVAITNIYEVTYMALIGQ